jgi:hypothetical protein
MTGPNGAAFSLAVIVDSGADYSVFPQWVAGRLGFSLAGTPPDLTTVSSVGGGGLPAWFRPVTLEVQDLGGVQRPFRWDAWVGFVAGPSFATSLVSGVLGVNGALDHFRRVEFDWYSLQNPEVVLRT